MNEEDQETKEEGSSEASTPMLPASRLPDLPDFDTVFVGTPQKVSPIVLAGIAKAVRAQQSHQLDKAVLGDVHIVLEHLAAALATRDDASDASGASDTDDATDSSDADSIDAAGVDSGGSVDDDSGGSLDDEAIEALIAYLASTVATHLVAIDPTGDKGARVLGDGIRVLLEAGRVRAAGEAAMQVGKHRLKNPRTYHKLTCVHARSLTPHTRNLTQHAFTQVHEHNLRWELLCCGSPCVICANTNTNMNHACFFHYSLICLISMTSSHSVFSLCASFCCNSPLPSPPAPPKLRHNS